MAALVMEGIHVYKGSGSQVSDAIDDFSRGLLSPLSLVERFEAPTPDSPADHDHPLDFPGEE
jgi:predicted Fe-Mo cluster-binding NifX family protein